LAPPFLIVESTDTSVIEDPDRKGLDLNAASLARLQRLDPYGVCIAGRVGVRKKCKKPRATHIEHLAQLFASPGPVPVELETLYSWRQANTAGDWEEQYAWSEGVRRGSRRGPAGRAAR
jgi:hypothetical protein